MPPVKTRPPVVARFLAALGALLAFSPVSRADEPLFHADDAAVEQRLADADRYLSSDALEGRGLTTRGLELAAEFIARQFHEAGLKTDVCDGTPFQKFPVTVDARLGGENRLVLTGPGQDRRHPEPRALIPGRDYTPLAAGDSCRFDLPLAFVGYGDHRPAEGYDDYAGVNAAGKAVIVLRQHPRQVGKDGKDHGCAACGHVPDAPQDRQRLPARGLGGDLRDRPRPSSDDQAGDDKLAVADQGRLPQLRIARCRCFHCRREAIEPVIRAALGTDLAGLEAPDRPRTGPPQPRPDRLADLRPDGHPPQPDDGQERDRRTARR